MMMRSAHLCRSNSYPLRPRRVTWIKTKRGALSNRVCKVGLNCKANKCSDAGTGDLDVLATRETSPCLDAARVNSAESKVSTAASCGAEPVSCQLVPFHQPFGRFEHLLTTFIPSIMFEGLQPWHRCIVIARGRRCALL